MANQHLTQKFTISSEVRLSLAIWFDDRSEVWRGSAAIERLLNNKWRLDSDACVEVVNHLRSRNDSRNREDCNYRLTAVGADLAAAEMGNELPVRFFRDNYIG